MREQNNDYIYHTESEHSDSSYITPSEPKQHRPKQRNHPDNIRPKGRRWLNIILWIVFMFLCTTPTIVAMLMVGFAASKPNMNAMPFIALVALYIVWSGLVALLLVWYYRKKGYEKMKPLRLVDIAWNILYFIATRIWTAVCMLLIALIFKEQSSPNDEALLQQVQNLKDFSNPIIVIALVIFLVHISFVGPFFEEITFRGIFKETLFSKFSFWWPMLISSAIFSLNHASGNIIGFFLYMGMGACFYLAYHRRKNIWDSYMVHVLNNATASVVILITLIFM
ncbi:CPBP family intramembrane glutamic endopeptidase [Staphylococcus simulans]|uniref:CPBP family intramembrane glutamic endopeptidase n=1 Tax=Staphylococcus simulans TaxID=1286 RepID=UPI000D02E42F|nr:CPBP family intramembrane glutamic endopeptidase [Staphylococcus simulans]